MKIPDEILKRVEKPARYIGCEINMVEKNPEGVPLRFAFCFPDVYEVGMSHLGTQIMYYYLNRREDCYCERAFAPWHDMEAQLRKEGLPLFALETGDPLTAFDFVGFTLQYEMSFTNVVNMLELSGIPVRSADRTDNDPIICAGGPCAYNPEPLAGIVDFFYIGEGEAGTLNRVLDIYKEYKNENKNENKSKKSGRRNFLERILKVPGIYVPEFYEADYNEDRTLKSFRPIHPDAPEKIRKVIVEDLDGVFSPDKQLVPLIETVHDRVTLEVFRGCVRGCRFCQAGYVYRPVREKEPDRLIEQAEKLIDSTGHQEISLVSLSTGDYSAFGNLAQGLMDTFKSQNVNLSLPSLRVDAFSLELMKKAQEVRKSSLTFAPEAGTQRMRDIINKGITQEEIINGCELAFKGGWTRLKLYFMVGLPGETDEDLTGIAKLSQEIVETFYRAGAGKKNRSPNIVLSTSCFVPKPFTPFQWEPQDSYETFMEKQRLIKKSITKKQIKFNYHDAKLSVVEAAIARGDRRICDVILEARRLGAKFDGWSESFNFEIWEQAFENAGVSMEFYASRPRGTDELLPWDHIDVGVSKGFLLKEKSRAESGETTPNCREACGGCGANIFGAKTGGVCVEK